MIGDLFIHKNLTGDIYLNLPEEMVGNVILEDHIHFQQDGVPPHCFLPETVAKRFPGRWFRDLEDLK